MIKRSIAHLLWVSGCPSVFLYGPLPLKFCIIPLCLKTFLYIESIAIQSNYHVLTIKSSIAHLLWVSGCPSVFRYGPLSPKFCISPAIVIGIPVCLKTFVIIESIAIQSNYHLLMIRSSIAHLLWVSGCPSVFRYGPLPLKFCISPAIVISIPVCLKTFVIIESIAIQSNYHVLMIKRSIAHLLWVSGCPSVFRYIPLERKILPIL